jgi:membrane protein DedA with SNARE-associated domain
VYSPRFTLVLAGLALGLGYVLAGAGCYAVGYRRGADRLKRFGETLLTRSPVVIVAVAVAYALSTADGSLGVAGLLVAAVGAFVPPVRALMVALDDDATE